MTNTDLITAINKFPVFGAIRSVRCTSIETDSVVVVPIGIKLVVHHTAELNQKNITMQLLHAHDNKNIFKTDVRCSFKMILDDIEFIGYENKPVE